MRHVGQPTYCANMTEDRPDGLIRHPSVTIEAAAELTNEAVATLRGWAGRGALLIERRGDMDVVQLDEVRAVASKHRASRRGALQDRLRDRDSETLADVVSIVDLQQLARERGDSGNAGRKA